MRARKDLLGKVALVTGAASGIGRATALALSRAGADLVICDVDETGLAVTAESSREAGSQVMARRVDVSSKEAMRAFAAEVHETRPAVDVLVNNAGVGLSGGFLDTSLEDWEWVLSINLHGVIHGCHYFVPPMVARAAGGYVVNVSSAAGIVANEMLSAYSTTKFAVFGLSEALRAELVPHGIGVATICPGLIDTAIVQSSRMLGRFATPDVRARVERAFRERARGPDVVADAIVSAVTDRRTVVPVTPEAWAMYLLKRLAPDTTALLARKVGEIFR